MDLSEQSDMNPSQPFRTENQSQFQPQYTYPQGTSAFAMDQDMNMSADGFAATVQAHAGTSLDNAAGRSSSSQGPASMNTAVTGMAPPQNASHPYSPGGARPSIDESQDAGLAGGDPKRKRSKVSRACDECRRKKVRCDAAADDGTIKTCSNCVRAGLTCEYSRVPMKRGPSKGYIKELSERVQQVESLQMALSNAPGYRQSLDATGGVYPEQPYSPGDPMSMRRNLSFSTDQRSPFVGPEYHRDRMPSLGGWNSGSPQSTVFRERDRGSIALAPDQQPTNPISFAKPFWAQDTGSPPPAKRQKMDTEEVSKPELGSEFLTPYFRGFHTYLPILPDADTTIAIIEKASSRAQHAFVAAVKRLPPLKSKTQNGDMGKENTASLTSSFFKSRQDLEEFMWNAARESPQSRSAEDNLLYIWTYLLMGIEAENDLTRLHDGGLPRTVLIKQAVDLGWSCVTAASCLNEDEPRSPYLQHFARAWHCASIPARLHALAVGSGNPIPRYFQQYTQKKVPGLHEVLPNSGIIVALTATQLSLAARMVQSTLPPSQFGRTAEIELRMMLQESFDQTIEIETYSEGNEVMLEHLRLFLDLTLSRYTENFHPMQILRSASSLAAALRRNLTASDVDFVYNPFNLHFFTLATISLLEFSSEGPETEMFRIANGGIQDVRVVLEQISEQDHVEDEQQQQQDDRAVEGPDITRKPIHWSDALLKMIDGRLEGLTTSNANGSSNNASLGASNIGDGSSATIDFSLLLRHGYLTVLAQQVH